MFGVIDDRDELKTVIQQALNRGHLVELFGTLTPAEESLDDLMTTATDEEVEIRVLTEGGGEISVWLDLLDDPLNGWDLKLRGWRVSPEMASV